MIRIRHIILTLTAAAGSLALPATAQSSSAAAVTAGNELIERIETAGNGMVDIDIPSSLLYQIMRDDLDLSLIHI